ncbi:MAG TPA: ElyC/SanA/YdcF family protein [Anaerolineales bacterium]|jgi:SanA protein
MFKRILRFLWRLLLAFGLLGILGLFLPRLITAMYSVTRVYTIQSVPAGRVAIVFGAGLRHDGTATAILRDRVMTAAQLYFEGKVVKLLMSGDNSTVEYNEPVAMQDYALSLGVPRDAIVLDYAGRRTYDTCYRAKTIFKLDNAILVTQDFHLPRALFLCNALGLEAMGVESNNLYYLKRSRLIWNTRELFATFSAFMDLYINRPVPILGEPEPIFKEK